MRLQRRIDANDLRVGLAVCQAGIAVKGVASNARRMGQGVAVVLVKQDPDRQMKGVMAFAFEAVEQLLDARFVRQGRICVGLLRGRLGGVFAAQPVDVIEFFRGLVVRFKCIVFQRPRWRNSIGMSDFVEVPLPQAQQHGTVDLAVAADKVVKSGVKALAIGTVP